MHTVAPQKASDAKLGMSTVLAVLLAVVVLFRPWRDGIAFPAQNAYFIVPLMIPAAVWAAGLLFGPNGGRMERVLTGIFAALLAVMAVSSVWSIHLDFSVRALLNWTALFFAFAVTANGLRTETARGIVLTAFIVTLVAGAAWAIFHLYIVMPNIRDALSENPRAVSYYFGSSEMHPQLAHRLRVNRAYGATLFPNALAALMLLAIPTVFGALVRVAGRAEEEAAVARAPMSLLKSLSTGASLAASIWLVLSLVQSVLSTQLPAFDERFSENTVAGANIGFALLVGGGVGYGLRAHGFPRMWLWCQTLVLPIGLLLCCTALLLTYSRGGMLALAAASVWTLLLVYFPRKRSREVVAAVLVTAVILGGVSASAQNFELGREGVAADVTDVSSFGQRLDYWRVAASMIAANPWHGVGPGAFGVAYATYMYPGAATSRMAHNDYLQFFAETGAIGFALFAGFWLFFGIWGARRIAHMPAGGSRALHAGMYAGVIAFVLHACIDFNFFNPSLATMAFILAGTFVAAQQRHSSYRPHATNGNRLIRATGAVALSGVAVLTIVTAYIFIVDYALTGNLPLKQKLRAAGARLEMQDRFNVSRFYLEKISENRDNRGAVLYGNFGELRRIIPNTDRILSFGVPGKIQGNNTIRRLDPGKPLTPDVSIIVADVEGARAALYDSADAFLSDLKQVDRLYPLIFEVSVAAAEWCELLRRYAATPERQAHYAARAVVWAEEAVERSPKNSFSYALLGKTVWHLAGLKRDPGLAQADYERALEAFHRACRLHPTSLRHWQEYLSTADALRQSYKKAGRTADYERVSSKAALARQQIEMLQQKQ